MRILITGSNGLLGQKLVGYCQKNQLDFFATSLGENRNSNCPEERFSSLDITDRFWVQQICEGYRPTHIINTAALTNVDLCEDRKEQCHNINVTGVENLLVYAKSKGCHLQQISTDFIFDGQKGNYTESDEPNPLSEYGKSKLKAERLILNSNYDNFSIVRTSVVYGVGENLSKSNIVLWALDALKNSQDLSIVNDQFRAPTFAEDLALGCMKIIENNEKGIFNMTGPVAKSMYELICEIADYLEVSTDSIKEISSETLNQKALRPKHTGMDLSKSRTTVGYDPIDFKSSLFLIERQF